MIDPPGPDGAPLSLAQDGSRSKETTDFLETVDRMFAAGARQQMRSLAPGDGEPISDAMLLLSGGSQNGAFGAGFLAEWSRLRERRGKQGLPRFRLVTGISTGALQSTFAFLNEAALIEQNYTIASEADLLDIFTPGGGLRSESPVGRLRGALSLARRGALSDLQPLREKLAGTKGKEAEALISDAVLLRVADEAGPDPDHPRRMLLVGAVEMDTGDAFVFDLTKAARLYKEGQTWMRACYIEALMASASVPMAALPVFIDGKMYIDGGARFGVISDFSAYLYQRVAQQRQAERRAEARAKGIILPDPLPAEPMYLYMLVNGTLEAGHTCHLRDCAKHPLPPPDSPMAGQHGAWSIDKVGLRAMSILINQSYRSSVFWATTRSQDLGFHPLFARIEDDAGRHPARLDMDVPGGEELTCELWRRRDVEKSRPLEFHPRYMRCLISYGAKRAATEDWARHD
ncbi:patatin-like phospholipase family protein [Sphingobium sp. HBC34]|uniref:Patatin-like phospholipase family protein n=1 Tax=Sphingobium cyanobacteriorum TaxID=3063954 RepID=A0ABT8ZPZ3_9SPHN|nr:patatin-like phospholipase family protein [Sphingobium sp. HBC34]MDO7836581.1 patatin-like phospholipase family protein [Sphingobium sp. HBC34]